MRTTPEPGTLWCVTVDETPLWDVDVDDEHELALLTHDDVVIFLGIVPRQADWNTDVAYVLTRAGIGTVNWRYFKRE